MYQVSISEAAQLDILEAKNWYERKLPNLGNRFFGEIKSKVKLNSKRPESYRIRYSSIRVAFCNTFPYGIHFNMYKENQEVLIIGVYHTSQDPKIWTTRKN